MYEQGAKLFLEDEALAMATDIQRLALVNDDRQGLVEEYLDTELPSNWSEMDILERSRYLDKPMPGLDNEAKLSLSKRMVVCPLEIACEALGYDRGKADNSVSRAINLMMAKIPGWKKAKSTMKRDFYGPQRVYVRAAE